MASTKTTNAVISYLLEFGDSPRIDIAKALSLTKASVTLVTNEMLEKKIIIEKGEIFDETKKTIRGRRKILLSINPDYKVTVGVALLKDKLIIGITNLKGDVFAKTTVALTTIAYPALIEKITENIELLLKDNLIKEEDILALGVVLSRDCDKYQKDVSLEDRIINVKRDLQAKVTYNVVVDTIAKSSLVAQRVFGNENCEVSTMMLSFVENVDIGISINSNMFTGKGNFSGGYLLIEKALIKYRLDNDLTHLIDIISVCMSVMDMHRVYGFGDVLSRSDILSEINGRLTSDVKIKTPIMTEDSLFLAGCGQALYDCLVL